MKSLRWPMPTAIYIIYYPIGFYVIDTFVLIAYNNLDRMNKVEAETLEIFWQISYRLFDSLSKLISSVYYVSKRHKSYRNTKMDFIRWWYPMQTIHIVQWSIDINSSLLEFKKETFISSSLSGTQWTIFRHNRNKLLVQIGELLS